jgi:hypothetical protein
MLIVADKPDPIEAEARTIASYAFCPAVVVVPTAEGAAVVGPFADQTAAWVWIDHYEAFLPKTGVVAVTPLDPKTAIQDLVDEGLL